MISPDGNRALVEARGEIFSLPAEDGYVQNLTRNFRISRALSGMVARWKIHGYWSDKSGEYELTVKDMTAAGVEKKLTSMGRRLPLQILFWSPN
jgi:tricorn protease